MFIYNLKYDDVFKCKGAVYRYLSGKIPAIGMDNDLYCFKKDDKLNDALNNAPAHIKILVKVVRY